MSTTPRREDPWIRDSETGPPSHLGAFDNHQPQVLHLSTSDSGGGGSRAAYRLHKALRSAGISSEMLVLNKLSTDTTVHRLTLSPRFMRRLSRWFARQRNSLRMKWALRPNPRIPREAFSLASSPYGRDVAENVGRPQLFNLHWTAGFVDLGFFFRQLGNTTPIVWRPSDMYPFTGGCHYSHRCKRYEDSCGCCPYLGSERHRDLSRRELKTRQRAYRSLSPEKLHIVAQSRWMAEIASQSRAWRRFPVTVIPNGVDLRVFQPRDRQIARAAFELPAESRIIGFASDDVGNFRKGLSTLAEAVGQLAGRTGISLLSVGGGSFRQNPTLPWRLLGRIDDDRLLAMAYSAMDVFVAPSLQDTFPNTVIEAMACGIPVIGARTGGLLDVIRPGESGWFFEPGSPTSLGQNLREIVKLSREDLVVWGNAARREAEREYDVSLQARRYIQLYGEILARQT